MIVCMLILMYLHQWREALLVTGLLTLMTWLQSLLMSGM